MPTATYDNGNQLASWNGTAATTDRNGNLLSDPSLSSAYTWNERNQLSSARVGGVASSFTYDAIGRRVAQTAGSLTTQYVYDLLNVAQEQFSAGGVSDMLPGLGLDQYFSRVDSSGTSAVLPDVLGSTLGLVNSSGAIGTGYGYGSFGQTTTSGASSTNPLQYTGREKDSSGLYFMRARYYNPIAQRFISPDPIGLIAGQVNFYAYVFNQPMSLTDPLGLKGGSMNGDTPVPPRPPPSPPVPAPPVPTYYEGVNAGATGSIQGGGLSIGNLSDITFGVSASVGNITAYYSPGGTLDLAVLYGLSLGAGISVGFVDPNASAPVGILDIGLGHNLGVSVGLSRDPTTNALVVSSIGINIGPSVGLPVGIESPPIN